MTLRVAPILNSVPCRGRARFAGLRNGFGGEQVNGDNLLEIHDEEIATAFAIEALELVDHFEFLDRLATGPKGKTAKKQKSAIKTDTAAAVGWFLGTTGKWVEKFYDPDDLHFVDRELFAD